MDGLLEFVFESVPDDNVGLFLEKVICSVSNVQNLTHSEIEDYLDNDLAMNHEFWNRICVSTEDVVYFLNIDKLAINNLFVKNISIRIIHYDGKTDIAIMASSEDFKVVNIRNSKIFYSWAEELANSFHITHFYGGLDPAMDKETQLYSNQGAGPNFEI